MTIDIIVPHYREPWHVCRYLFDTIATQRGINFDDIRVTVVNDGDAILCGNIREAMYTFSTYPFTVDYIVKEHDGVSEARNCGIRESDADYVMLCDCDDGFLNNYALHVLMESAKDNPDLIIADFLEETLDDNGNLKTVRHERDMTFVHGKLYRRQFLIDHDIFFHPEMTLHEDGCFNLLAYTIAHREGKVNTVSPPLYLWRWNGNSVVRKDSKDFVLKTYADVITGRTWLCRQLKWRGYDLDYHSAVCMTILNCYYDFQKASYQDAVNRTYIDRAKQAVKAYWEEFKSVFYTCTDKLVGEIARIARENAYKNGMLFESEDLTSFLRMIEETEYAEEEEVKPDVRGKYAVFISTRNWYENMVVSIKSLLCNSDVDRVFAVTEDDEFPYELPEEVCVLNGSRQSFIDRRSPNAGSHFTYLCVERAAYGYMFDGISRVLSLDSDLVVVNDISGLWDIDLNGNYCAGVIDKGIGKPGYYNAGVILMDLDKLRDDHITDRMIDLLNREYRVYIDQDALNECCGGKILELPLRYNESPVTGKTDDPAIVHYVGVDKTGGANAARRHYWNKYQMMTWGEVAALRMERYGKGLTMTDKKETMT